MCIRDSRYGPSIGKSQYTLHTEYQHRSNIGMQTGRELFVEIPQFEVTHLHLVPPLVVDHV